MDQLSIVLKLRNSLENYFQTLCLLKGWPTMFLWWLRTDITPIDQTQALDHWWTRCVTWWDSSHQRPATMAGQNLTQTCMKSGQSILGFTPASPCLQSFLSLFSMPVKAFLLFISVRLLAIVFGMEEPTTHKQFWEVNKYEHKQETKSIQKW